MAGWESCPYVSTDGRARVCGVGACACKVTTSTDLREASGPRIDRIPPTRPPPWWRRQYRDIKKLIFLTPSTCPIDVFGPVANRRILKQMHGVHIKSNKTGPQLLHFAFQVLLSLFLQYTHPQSPSDAVTHHSFPPATCASTLARLRRYSHTPAFALWVLTPHAAKVSLTQL